MNLTQHDSRLVTAAISYLLAITGSGTEGANAINVIKDERARALLADATFLLAVAQEGLDGNTQVSPNKEVFSDNLERLEKIAKELLGDKETQVATLEPIATDGTVTGPKQYQLWLTHDEIHLVHWAVMLAEAGIVRDPVEMAKALFTYDALRSGMDSFVDKFNQVHEAARVDDGEVVG